MNDKTNGPDSTTTVDQEDLASLTIRTGTLRRNPHMIGLFLAVAIMGGMASVLRVILIDLVESHHNTSFPFGTLVVNLIGCFVFGLVWALFDKRVTWQPEYKLVILAGFAGAFTTYSTYAFDTWQLIEKAQYLFAALNLITQTVVGISMVICGVMFGRWIG